MFLEINGEDEFVYNLHDVVNIIKKHYNKELAIEMDRMVEEQEAEIERLKNELEYMI